MTEDSPSARHVIHESGFSDELKKQLEARIKDSAFRSENAGAFAELAMPVSLFSFAIRTKIFC